MRRWMRLAVVFGLLVPMFVVSAPVGAQDDDFDFYFSTWAGTPSPHQFTDETVWVSICWDEDCDDPAGGVPVHTVWNYRTTTSYLDWHTGYDGQAAMIRNISGATCGFTVRVDIYVFEDQTQIDSAYFTPRC